MASNGIFLPILAIGLFAGASFALQCFKCGQYNDGVGSITPCTNYTHMQIVDCPSLEHVYCIKYISEGSTVRDCVAQCGETDSWSARTYCCKEDGCNSSPITRPAATQLLAAAVLLLLTGLLTH